MHYTFSAPRRGGQSKKEHTVERISPGACYFLGVPAEIHIEKQTILTSKRGEVDSLEDFRDFFCEKGLRISWQLKSR